MRARYKLAYVKGFANFLKHFCERKFSLFKKIYVRNKQTVVKTHENKVQAFLKENIR